MRYELHVPVLLEEVIQFLRCNRGHIYVDCTVGTGGHSARILEKSAPDGILIGIDIDAESLSVAKERLFKFRSRFMAVHSDFRRLPEILDGLRIKAVDGILIDLGLSSFQLSNPLRGFTFQKEGPLDMRYNRNKGLPAWTLINSLSEERIKKMLKQYGQETHGPSIAREIMKWRRQKKIEKTSHLCQIVLKAYGQKRWKIHPATKTFQALRIAVNKELESLDRFLERSVERLKKGARLVVLSYHSLEDRIAKQTFRKLSSSCICPPSLPVCRCFKKEIVKVLTPHPITPGEAEVLANPRSRSAKMRVVEKI